VNDAAALLWSNWALLPTSARQRCLDLLLSRGDNGARLTIAALKESKLSRGDLTASQTQMLRQHPNPEMSRPALQLLGQVDSNRASVIEKFRPVLNLKGDSNAGEKIFVERCAVCHRFAGQGNAVGPDMESVRGNGREYLLTHILDPNREVNSRFVVYTAELKDGESVNGMVSRESDNDVVMRLANGEEKNLLRAQIMRLAASAQSLMPVGLEEGLDNDAIAGLLEFLVKK
jgi:putative heme-binding domain-containing protein